MYEYNVLEADGPPSAQQLTELAQDGWRLVQVLLSTRMTRYYIYLERRIEA